MPLLWLTIARPYNEALVALSHNLLPDGVTLSVLGTHILIDYTPAAPPFSLDGLTLHSGLVLMTVLILAAVGVGLLPRIGWLLVFFAAGFVLHVVGVTLLARGVAWASSNGSAEESAAVVLRLFAIFLGLLPALVGGAWGEVRAWRRPRLTSTPRPRMSFSER